MSLLEIIQNLNTTPLRQEDEYECTSDFLEWFYYNIYREEGFDVYPILEEISKEPDYALMFELCKSLINFFEAKNLDNETLSTKYETMKKWTFDNIMKYN
jgi:hypothetical protein